MKSARFDTRLPNLESQLESILAIDTFELFRRADQGLRLATS